MRTRRQRGAGDALGKQQEPMIDNMAMVLRLGGSEFMGHLHLQTGLGTATDGNGNGTTRQPRRTDGMNRETISTRVALRGQTHRLDLRALCGSSGRQQTTEANPDAASYDL